MPFEADLHVHTQYSSDGQGEPREVVLAAKRAGLVAIAVTDHNTPRGAREVARAAQGHDLLVVPGLEVSSFAGHILALGVTEPIPAGLSAEETIRRVEDHGGLAVASHPGRFYTGLSIHRVRAAGFQAVEVANGHSSLRQNRRALLAARSIRAGMTGGSDAHWPDEIGLCRTVLDRQPTSVDEVLDDIRDRRTSAVGEGLAPAAQLNLDIAMFGRWLRRGGRRI